MDYQILLAGFGGQGVLFAGKFLTYAGLLMGKNVSWLPSYGPEMRGGTANCSVIISDKPVGSPIVLKPNVLVAMNLPSYDKFEPAAAPGALVIADTSLVTRAAGREDVTTIGLPATRMADANGLKGLANMILTGMLVGRIGLCGDQELHQAMSKTIPPRKAELFENNIKALLLGKNFTT